MYPHFYYLAHSRGHVTEISQRAQDRAIRTQRQLKPLRQITTNPSKKNRPYQDEEQAL